MNKRLSITVQKAINEIKRGGAYWLDCYGNKIYADYPRTIKTTILSSRNDWIMEIEPHIATLRGRSDGDWHESEHEQRLEVGSSDTSNALSTVDKDNLVVLGWTRDEKGAIDNYHPVNVANCVTSTKRGNTQNYVQMTDGIRIRRLTERELFRLMDVDEPDIDTILSVGIPKTQLAKLAGNSIVVAVLYHIFNRLLVEQQPQRGEQMALF